MQHSSGWSGRAEREVYLHTPQRYGRLARLVDLSLRVDAKPCTGSGCDEDKPCKRHSRSALVAFRHDALVKRWRALDV